MLKRLLVVCVMLCIAVTTLTGQSREDIYEKYDIYRNPLMVFLNHFSWTVTSGYGLTNYKHSLEGFYFLQDNSGQYILDNRQELGPTFPGYQYWLSNAKPAEVLDLSEPLTVPYHSLDNPVNNEQLLYNQQLINTDTLPLSFSNAMPTVPILASVHFDFRKYRIGFGFQHEKHYMRSLEPSAAQDLIRPYEPNFESVNYRKWFGILGYRFYRFWDWNFMAEVQLGHAKPRGEINTTAVGIGQNFFVNAGVSMEYVFSEYLRLVIRPGYDFKSYVINLPDATSIRHSNRAFMVQAGISFNIPEIPRTPYQSDHVQLKHVITDPKSGRLREVRGQRMWKRQNPKVGENHRRLWRYKLKNRRKMHPY